MEGREVPGGGNVGGDDLSGGTPRNSGDNVPSVSSDPPNVVDDYKKAEAPKDTSGPPATGSRGVNLLDRVSELQQNLLANAGYYGSHTELHRRLFPEAAARDTELGGRVNQTLDRNTNNPISNGGSGSTINAGVLNSRTNDGGGGDTGKLGFELGFQGHSIHDRPGKQGQRNQSDSFTGVISENQAFLKVENQAFLNNNNTPQQNAQDALLNSHSDSSIVTPSKASQQTPQTPQFVSLPRPGNDNSNNDQLAPSIQNRFSRNDKQAKQQVKAMSKQSAFARNYNPPNRIVARNQQTSSWGPWGHVARTPEGRVRATDAERTTEDPADSGAYYGSDGKRTERTTTTGTATGNLQQERAATGTATGTAKGTTFKTSYQTSYHIRDCEDGLSVLKSSLDKAVGDIEARMEGIHTGQEGEDDAKSVEDGRESRETPREFKEDAPRGEEHAEGRYSVYSMVLRFFYSMFYICGGRVF